MKIKHYLWLLPLLAVFFSFAAVAADVVPVAEMEIGQLIMGVVSAVAGFFSKDVGSTEWYVRLAPLVTLLLSALKSSKLSGIWNWMGDFKAYAAPLLSLLLVVMGMLGQGQAITIGTILSALGAGLGSIAIHELLDTLKRIPGLNGWIATFIDIVKGLLGGKTPSSSPTSPAPSQPAN